VVDPELVARKVAAMSLGRGQAREARLAAEAQLLAGWRRPIWTGRANGANSTPDALGAERG